MYGLLGLTGHSGELAGKKFVRPLFLLVGFFCLVEILLNVSGVQFSGIFWAGRARHPGPPSQPRYVSLEYHNVGGWLTHGDIALDAGVDFLAIAERRLIPASLRGAPLALPTFATAQSRSFFDCGRAVGCLLPLAAGRFMHLFVHFYWTKGAFRRICRQKQCEPSFSPICVFLFSRNSRARFWGLIFWHFWTGRARHPGPTSAPPPPPFRC